MGTILSLTFSVRNPTLKGASVPDTQPNPLFNAMMVALKFGLRSIGLTQDEA